MAIRKAISAIGNAERPFASGFLPQRIVTPERGVAGADLEGVGIGVVRRLLHYTSGLIPVMRESRETPTMGWG